MTLQLYLCTQCHSLCLSVFRCFREGAQLFVQNHRLLPDVNLQLRAGVVVGQILPIPAPTPTQAKTVDSDRLQFRSRLRLCSPAFNPRPDGPLDFPRPDGGGLLRPPPCNSAPITRSEKTKSAFESSSKIITKVFQSIFR